jgi:hypothetical protein
MKRAFLCIAAFMLVLALVPGGEALAQKKTFLTLSSGSPGGAYYPLGGGMAVIIEKTVEGFRCASESTGASVENTRLVGGGESDMGMVMGSIAYNATLGKDPFKQKYPLVALFQMYPAPEHIVTTKQSGIRSIKDLKGKKVSIDVPGSGCANMAKAILEEYGFRLNKDITIANLSQNESVQALKDGVYPGAAVLDLASSRDIVLIPIERPMADKIVKKYPYYIKIPIPAKTYPGQDKEILCLGDSNVLVANRKMSDDVAYKVTKAIFSNVKTGKFALVNIHPVAAQLTPANAVNSPIPLHPGAIRYFREVKALK